MASVGKRLVLVLAAMLAGGGALTVVPSCKPGASRPTGLVVTSATYVQRWDREGTEPSAEAPGSFVVKSNLGYEVRVDRGFVVDSSASLVDCLGAGGDVWEKAADKAAGRAARGLGISFVGVAHAGHSQTPDPSSLARATLTDLTRAQGEITIGETRFAETRYCRVHFLVAGGAAPSAYTATFPDLDTTRTTLYVRGAWRRSGGEPRPFELRSKSVDAVLLDLPAVLAGKADGSAAVVVLERRLGTMFDDVDLASLAGPATPAAPEGAAAKTVLRNLHRRARVRVFTR